MHRQSLSNQNRNDFDDGGKKDPFAKRFLSATFTEFIGSALPSNANISYHWPLIIYLINTRHTILAPYSKGEDIDETIYGYINKLYPDTFSGSLKIIIATGFKRQEIESASFILGNLPKDFLTKIIADAKGQRSLLKLIFSDIWDHIIDPKV